MQTRIQKIGDNFGLILPKEMLDACGFGTDATVAVQNKTLVISPSPRAAREGWEEALRQIPSAEMDRDFEELKDIREVPNKWDDQDWHWLELKSDEQI